MKYLSTFGLSGIIMCGAIMASAAILAPQTIISQRETMPFVSKYITANTDDAGISETFLLLDCETAQSRQYSIQYMDVFTFDEATQTVHKSDVVTDVLLTGVRALRARTNGVDFTGMAELTSTAGLMVLENSGNPEEAAQLCQQFNYSPDVWGTQ